MKKLFVSWPENHWQWLYALLTEDWFVLASHLCSYEWYAKNDLLERREDRKEKRKDFLRWGYTIEIADKEMNKILVEKNSKFTDETMEQYWKENMLF